jgi:putative zinc finger protein
MTQEQARPQALETPGGEHLTDAEFVAFVQEEMTPAQATRIDTHLERCPACTGQLDAFFMAEATFPEAVWAAQRSTFEASLRARLEADGILPAAAPPPSGIPWGAVLQELPDRLVRCISSLWHPFLAGQMATAAAASPQEHRFYLDEGEITLTCDWSASSPNQPATLRVAWEATLSRPTDLWLRFTQPDDPTALYSEVRLGENWAGEAIFLEQTIRFDPARQPWALALVLKELQG